MKFKCSGKTMREAFNILGHATWPGRGVRNSATCHVSASPAAFVRVGVSYAGFGTRVEFQAEVEQDGDVYIPAHVLDDLARTMSSDDDVVIETNAQNAYVFCGRSKSCIKPTCADNFCSPPSINCDVSVTVDATSLTKMLKRVIFAIPNNEHGPVPRGVLMQLSPVVAMAALDGYRMSEVNPVDVGNIDVDAALVVPLRTIKNLLFVLESRSCNKVIVSTDANRAAFFIDDGTIIYGPVVGTKFPSYNSAITHIIMPLAGVA